MQNLMENQIVEVYIVTDTPALYYTNGGLISFSAYGLKYGHWNKTGMGFGRNNHLSSLIFSKNAEF